MREIFSFIFDKLTDPLGLPIEAWKEYLILLAIGELAYIIAFYIVGNMYDNGDISTSAGGSIFHWGIRLVIFFVMWIIAYAVIWLVKMITEYWVWIVCGLGGLLLIGAIVILSINIFAKKGENKNER